MRHSRTREKIKVFVLNGSQCHAYHPPELQLSFTCILLISFLLKKNKVSKLLLHVHSIFFFKFCLFYYFFFAFSFYYFTNLVEIHTSNCIVFVCRHLMEFNDNYPHDQNAFNENPSPPCGILLISI